MFTYYGRQNVGLPIPDGSYIEPSSMDIVDLVLRYNNTTNEIEPYSLKKEQFIGSSEKCIKGQRIADTSRLYTAKSDNVVFDDRIIAFVYNWWDAKTKDKYPEHILTYQGQSWCRKHWH